MCALQLPPTSVLHACAHTCAGNGGSASSSIHAFAASMCLGPAPRSVCYPGLHSKAGHQRLPAHLLGADRKHRRSPLLSCRSGRPGLRISSRSTIPHAPIACPESIGPRKPVALWVCLTYIQACMRVTMTVLSTTPHVSIMNTPTHECLRVPLLVHVSCW